MEHGGQRYGSVQSVLSEYHDYLEMCVKLGYSMRNSFVLFPRDLQKAHDRVQRRVKIKDSIQLREDFAAAMEAISRNLDFEKDNLRIVVPEGPDDLVAEGQALHHCISTRAESVARRESIVLFIRLADDPGTPLVTCEIKGRHVIEARGMGNCLPTPEVQTFIDQFERQVLMAA